MGWDNPLLQLPSSIATWLVVEPLLHKHPTTKTSMGRRRQTDKHLPQRMYLVHGSYWFRPLGAKAQNLGRDLGIALALYGQAIGSSWAGRTLGDVIDRYRIEVLPLKRSEKTRRNEGDALTKLKNVFGHMLPVNITQPDLYGYIDKRRTPKGKPAPEAARHEIQLLGHVFKKAIRWGVAKTNPVTGLEKFTKKPRAVAIPMSEVDAVRALATDRMRVAIDLAVCMGPRRGDLLTLKRSHLTDKGILFLVGKSQRHLLIAWSEELRAIVARAKALPPQVPGDFLLRTRTGEPYTGDGFSSNWQRLMKKHVELGGMRFKFHELRSVAADEGTLEEARDRLGHADASTTQRYYRRAPQKGTPRT